MIVKAQCHVHAVQRPILDHGFGAAEDFLGRLEQQADAACHVGRKAFQCRGNAQQGGGVHVVAAGMHDAGVFTCEGEARPLFDRQRIHVTADGEYRAGPTALDGADHAGAANAGLAGDPEAGKFARHHAGGALFLERQFRMGVKVTANCDQSRFLLPDCVGDRCADIVDGAHVNAARVNARVPGSERPILRPTGYSWQASRAHRSENMDAI
jgi:hypothetical protein